LHGDDLQVMVFWIVMHVMMCVVQYQCFRGPHYLNLEATWRRRQHLPKHWYPTTSLHGITTQKTM